MPRNDEEGHKAHAAQRCAATVVPGQIFMTRFNLSNLVMSNPILHTKTTTLLSQGSSGVLAIHGHKPQWVTLETNGEERCTCAAVEMLYTLLDCNQWNHISPRPIYYWSANASSGPKSLVFLMQQSDRKIWFIIEVLKAWGLKCAMR